MKAPIATLGTVALLATLANDVAAKPETLRVSRELSKAGLALEWFDIGDIGERWRLLDLLESLNQYNSSALSGGDAMFVRGQAGEGPLAMYSTSEPTDSVPSEPTALTLAFAQIAAEVLNESGGPGLPLGVTRFLDEDFLQILDPKYDGQWTGPSTHEKGRGKTFLVWRDLSAPIGFPVQPKEAVGMRLTYEAWSPYSVTISGGRDNSKYLRDNWVFAAHVDDGDFLTDYIVAGGLGIRKKVSTGALSPSIAVSWVADIDLNGATTLKVSVQFPETDCRAAKFLNSGIQVSESLKGIADRQLGSDPAAVMREFSLKHSGAYQAIAGAYAGPNGCKPQEYSTSYITAENKNSLLTVARLVDRF